MTHKIRIASLSLVTSHTHLGFVRLETPRAPALLPRRSLGGLNIFTLAELELRDVEGDAPFDGLMLFSLMTLSGRTKVPCFALHLKYR